MTITIGAWIIPVLLSAIMSAIMLRPYYRQSMYDVGPVERILWIIPILFVWTVFFAIAWWLK